MSIPCIICHEVFENDNNVIALNRCGHIYHGNCLEHWKKSSPQSRATCPLCQKPYDKRSIRKLYFNVEEPEIATQLQNDLKRQFEYNEKLQKEILQKNIEIDKIKEAWLQASNELNKIKTDYGIKCQAFSIIDTVNTEYLQDNMKLKEENSRLKIELDTIMQSKSHEIVKPNKVNVVDLTSCSNYYESDSDDIQIIESSGKNEVIVLDDDSNDVSQSKLPPKKRSCHSLEDNNNRYEADHDYSRSAKKVCENDDYKRFEDFILSQI